ncbi:MAG: hypothetical protein ACRET3_02260 [Burkholderiales bacterium]
MMRFNILLTVTWFALLTNLAGCAANMALLRHEKHYYRDASVLKQGADREHVTARLGTPIASVTRGDGKDLDLYRFDPGKGKDAPSRLLAIGHMLMSVGTIGLWEIVGMPVETALKDRPLTYLLVYDVEGKLAEFWAMQEWRPVSLSQTVWKKCELLGSLAAMRVQTPAAAQNAIYQIKDTLRVNSDREEAYQRASLACALEHYARDTG